MRLRQLELSREQFDIIVRGTDFNENTKEMLWEYLSTQEDVTQKELAESYGLTQGRLNHCMKRLGDHIRRLTRRRKLHHVTIFVEEKDLKKVRAMDALTRLSAQNKLDQMDIFEGA